MKKYNHDLEKKITQRNHETSSVKTVVSEMLKFYKLNKKFNEIDVMEAWQIVMGESVARRTLKLYVQDRTMYLKLESASLKNELMMAKSQILEKLNQTVGKNTLDDLIFQ